MAQPVIIDMHELSVTPVFKYITVEDVPASEREGRLVMKTIEAVEVRLAGSKNYSPVFPVDAQWRREGNKVITYAERWADQYRAFLAGRDQRAMGTPLEMLKTYGISDAQLSLCRAWKIYTIEALYGLEGQSLKNLGMAANALKEMATAYMRSLGDSSATQDELERLRREVADLRAVLPPQEPTEQDREAAVKKSDDEFASMDKDALKAFIAAKAGALPRGNPSRDTLVQMARELQGAA